MSTTTRIRVSAAEERRRQARLHELGLQARMARANRQGQLVAEARAAKAKWRKAVAEIEDESPRSITQDAHCDIHAWMAADTDYVVTSDAETDDTATEDMQVDVVRGTPTTVDALNALHRPTKTRLGAAAPERNDVASSDAPDEVKADKEMVLAAIQASEPREDWSQQDLQQRLAALRQLAARMREQKARWRHENAELHECLTTASVLKRTSMIRQIRQLSPSLSRRLEFAHDAPEEIELPAEVC